MLLSFVSSSLRMAPNRIPALFRSNGHKFFVAADSGLPHVIEVDSGIGSPGPDLTPPQTEVQKEGRNWSPLMEIYSVRFLQKDKADAEKWVFPHIYGVIAVGGSCGTSIIFNRKFGEPRLINSEGLLSLSGMRRGLKVEGDILIKPCVLCCKSYCLFNDRPPGKLWSVRSKNFQYDKLLNKKIDTTLGRMEVQYVVYREATEAIVDITINGLVGERTTDFYGTIIAWNTKVAGTIRYFVEEDVSFNFGKNESAGLSLHLSRCAIVVPRNSFLVVDVNIHNKKGLFASETISFPVRLGGEELQTIHGKSGMIAVKVKWLGTDCSGEVQGSIMGGRSSIIQQKLCDGFSKPIYMHHLDGSWESSSRYMILDTMIPNGEYYNQRLMEVFSVRFVNHEKLDFSNIYGAIVMQVGIDNYILYNRKLGDPPCIDSEGFITLRMPCHGIEVSCRIELYSYLFDLETKTRSKYVEWWSNRHDDMPDLSYDKVLSERVGSMFGPIEVTLAVYFSGVVATLDVTLINFEDECLPEVHGHVKVKNDKTRDSRAVSWIFRKENKDTVTCISHIKSWGRVALPLLRQVVVVPRDSTMMVDIYICYGDAVFAFGELMFHAKLTGKESGFLIGSHGKIRVEVSWSRVRHYDKLGYCW